MLKESEWNYSPAHWNLFYWQWRHCQKALVSTYYIVWKQTKWERNIPIENTKAKSGSCELISPHLKWPIILSPCTNQKFNFKVLHIFLIDFWCQSCLNLSNLKFLSRSNLLDSKVNVKQNSFIQMKWTFKSKQWTAFE